MSPLGQDEQPYLGEMKTAGSPFPHFADSFRRQLEQVRMDKGRAMERLIEMVQIEMALERILEGGRD